MGRSTPPGRICVLHAVDAYLPTAENWIYPQIAQVAGVDGYVLARSLENVRNFPLEPGRLLVNPPPWRQGLGLPRLISGLAKRVGLKRSVICWIIRRCAPQVLHAHFGMRGWDQLWLARRLRIPLVTSFYGFDAWMLTQEQPDWKRRYATLFEEGGLFLVEGPAMKARLVQLGCAPDKVLVHRIGVDINAIPFRPRDFTSGLKVLMVGRFVEKKGLVDGLKACAAARAAGTKLRVTVVGDAAKDDPKGFKIKEQLQALAKSKELQGAVELTGFLPLARTRQMFEEHNVFLCPSKHASSGDAEGGSPVVLTEAMAAGLLCVGTRHCDIPEVILDGQTGYLCNSSDVDGLAQTLTTIGKNTNGVSQLATAARSHVERNFSLERQMQALGMVYQELLSCLGKSVRFSSDELGKRQNALCLNQVT